MGRTPLDTSFPVGARLRVLRQSLGLSQRELARRAGVTNANLSMIEQDKVSPALFTLEKILHALTLDLGDFFAAPETPQTVCKEADFDLVKRKGGLFRVMAPRAGDVSANYLARVTVYAQGQLDGLWLKGQGVVSGIVFNGTLCLMLDGVAHVLESGDGFEFCLNRKVGFINTADIAASMIISVECRR